MVNTKYERAYSEVLEILKYIPIQDYNKIPKEKIEIFQKYAGKNYSVSYSPSKTLDENNISKIAKGVIAILYRDYWASDKLREKINIAQNHERQKIEKEKRLLYNPDNIFEKEEIENIDEEKLPIEIKENNIFTKIILYLKSILNI